MEERGGFGQRRGGFRGGRRPSFTPKPVETGKEYEVDITETSRRGEGVARIQGLVVFVPSAKPGDHVTVKVTKVSSRFAEAEIAGKPEAKSEEPKE